MATRTVEHTVDLATVIETEIFTITHPTDYLGINRIVALLEQLNINYSGKELGSALNKLLHENKIEFAMGIDELTDLMNDEKKESPNVSLYFRRIATIDLDG